MEKVHKTQIKNAINKETLANVSFIEFNWSNWNDFCDLLNDVKVTKLGTYLSPDTLEPVESVTDIIGCYINDKVIKQDEIVVKTSEKEVLVYSKEIFDALYAPIE